MLTFKEVFGKRLIEFIKIPTGCECK